MEQRNENGQSSWQDRWQVKIEAWIQEQMSGADSGHGLDHVRRVVENAKRIGHSEQADANVYLPAAWLHDCVSVAKNSPERSTASTLAAKAAIAFLKSINYPSATLEPIYHCIEAHSFSANIACVTLEAQVVQDADRLEALGAIGISRCLMTGGSMRQRLYHSDQPFPIDRPPADNQQSIDHFFAKLLGLEQTMKTNAGRSEATKRTQFLITFLHQLADEIGVPRQDLQAAIHRYAPIKGFRLL